MPFVRMINYNLKLNISRKHLGVEFGTGEFQISVWSVSHFRRTSVLTAPDHMLIAPCPESVKKVNLRDNTTGSTNKYCLTKRTTYDFTINYQKIVEFSRNTVSFQATKDPFTLESLRFQYKLFMKPKIRVLVTALIAFMP